MGELCGTLSLISTSRRGQWLMRSAKTSRHLTLNDAVEIWRRRSNGEAQHKIAAAFNVNQGRISEILSGRRFSAAKRLAQNAQHDSGAARG
jgi:hypothetical protein